MPQRRMVRAATTLNQVWDSQAPRHCNHSGPHRGSQKHRSAFHKANTSFLLEVVQLFSSGNHLASCCSVLGGKYGHHLPKINISEIQVLHTLHKTGSYLHPYQRTAGAGSFLNNPQVPCMGAHWPCPKGHPAASVPGCLTGLLTTGISRCRECQEKFMQK